MSETVAGTALPPLTNESMLRESVIATQLGTIATKLTALQMYTPHLESTVGTLPDDREKRDRILKNTNSVATSVETWKSLSEAADLLLEQFKGYGTEPSGTRIATGVPFSRTDAANIASTLFYDVVVRLEDHCSTDEKTKHHYVSGIRNLRATCNEVVARINAYGTR